MKRPPIAESASTVALATLFDPFNDGSTRFMAMTTPLVVESRKGAVAWAALGIAPFPFPAHQTGRADFPHPAFRLASSQDTRRWSQVDPA